MASPSLTAAFTVTGLTIRASLTKGFCVQHCLRMRPLAPHGRDGTPLQRTPGLGEVWWLRPALPTGKGTAGGKPTPPAPIILLCALDSRGDRGPDQNRPRLPSESPEGQDSVRGTGCYPQRLCAVPALQGRWRGLRPDIKPGTGPFTSGPVAQHSCPWAQGTFRRP